LVTTSVVTPEAIAPLTVSKRAASSSSSAWNFGEIATSEPMRFRSAVRGVDSGSSSAMRLPMSIRRWFWSMLRVFL
jgi:hypothetical protein